MLLHLNATACIADAVYRLLQTGTLYESLLPLYGQNYNESPDANAIEIKVGDYNQDFQREVSLIITRRTK